MHLVLDDQLPGAENMRRDEVLLTRAEPALRIYGWAPETVSLGNSQTEADLDLDAVRAYELDVVKRRTGGGGILHSASEVTYAVVVPLGYPGLPGDLPRSFGFLSTGVVAAIRDLGLAAELESVPDLTRDALCYVRQQGTNVVVGGKKISGGAQRRTRSAVLQHGTVIVERDERRLAAVFRADVETICARVTSLRDQGLAAMRDEIVSALIAGFARALGPLIPARWIDLEPEAPAGWSAPS
jgi:lipoate-protein ligase A